MKKEEFEKTIQDIQEKLGNENSGLIADSLATLLSDNVNTIKLLDNKDKEIMQLKNDKENLINVNR